MVLHKQSHLVSAPRKTCWEWHGVAMTGIVLKSSTVRKWGGGLVAVVLWVGLAVLALRAK
jgi:hypothetical protein